MCVCVCMYGCYDRDTARGTPIFLVSRETALFRQTILRVLTKKRGCTVHHVLCAVHVAPCAVIRRVAVSKTLGLG